MGTLLGTVPAAAQPAPGTTPLVISSQSSAAVIERDLSISTSGQPVAPVHETFTETHNELGNVEFVLDKQDDGVLQHPDGPVQAIARGAVRVGTDVFPDHTQVLLFPTAYASGQAVTGTSFQSRLFSRATYDVLFQIPGPLDVLAINGIAFFNTPTSRFQLTVFDQTLGQTLWTFERTGSSTQRDSLFDIRQAFTIDTTHQFRLTAVAEVLAEESGSQPFPDPFSFKSTIDAFTLSAVPEPTTWLLMLAGLAVVAGAGRRRLYRG